MPTLAPKKSLPTLRVPLSATLPSELPRSPLQGLPDNIKLEDNIMKTPITPPTAYTDFLKALSPAMPTPMSARSCFSDKSSGKTTPTTQPSSAGSNCSCIHDSRKPSASAPLMPPSPYIRTNSARTPTALRRLRIPQSPVYSPATDSPRSAVLGSAVRSPFSPTEWLLEGKTRCYEAPRSATHRPVSVKQVVTRTVTYTRTPVGPAPKGKRRKMERE
ncbi:hypothetical protein MMC09_005989 [Bachmanniomyces sp. S44760]|nr:hypothetical protein [Bachmanniomyces sp. S44760]